MHLACHLGRRLVTLISGRLYTVARPFKCSIIEPIMYISISIYACGSCRRNAHKQRSGRVDLEEEEEELAPRGDFVQKTMAKDRRERVTKNANRNNIGHTNLAEDLGQR